MIIDGTRGSIARFVNHSCEPNCRIVKWIVAGKPRMALFAGDRPIMTGEELTYDYNFDPFSAKNVQECRCGAKNCRGILGPRLKDQKPAKTAATIGEAVKRAVSAGKRKLKEMLSGEKDENEQGKPKKRKMKVPIARSKSVKVVDAAKGLSRKMSKKVNKMSKKGEKTGVKETKSKIKNNGEKKQMLLSSRNSSLTLVATDEKKGEKVKGSPKGTPVKKTKKAGGSPTQTPAKKRVIKKKVASSKVVKSRALKGIGGNRGVVVSEMQISEISEGAKEMGESDVIMT